MKSMVKEKETKKVPAKKAPVKKAAAKEKEIVIKRTSKGLITTIICMVVLFFILMAAVVILGVITFDDGIYTKFDVGTTGNVLIKNKVQIYDIDTVVTSDEYTIEGYLKNISEKDYMFVTIEYTLYDEYGVIIDRVSDTIENLKAGKKWNFTLEYNDVNRSTIADYELTKVTVY